MAAKKSKRKKRASDGIRESVMEQTNGAALSSALQGLMSTVRSRKDFHRGA